jgi:hypothetical protein
MLLDFQVLSLADQDEVQNFAAARLALRVPDEIDRRFQSWEAKWRPEALHHYLPLGWSFIARNESREAVGFFLGQPLLFFRGQTQSLWIECIEASSAEVSRALIDVAVRVAREKHLQRALFCDAESLSELEAWKPDFILRGNIAVVKTAKG